jgi:hypothetical protein
MTDYFEYIFGFLANEDDLLRFGIRHMETLIEEGKFAEGCVEKINICTDALNSEDKAFKSDVIETEIHGDDGSFDVKGMPLTYQCVSDKIRENFEVEEKYVIGFSIGIIDKRPFRCDKPEPFADFDEEYMKDTLCELFSESEKDIAYYKC